MLLECWEPQTIQNTRLVEEATHLNSYTIHTLPKHLFMHTQKILLERKWYVMLHTLLQTDNILTLLTTDMYIKLIYEI